MHPGLERESGKQMELDVYLPEERLAFEYQGEGHYRDIYSLGSRWRQKQHDQEKRDACQRHGITLVEVPFWWDFEKSSLAATIQAQRDDVIREDFGGTPIGENPSLGDAQGDGTSAFRVPIRRTVVAYARRRVGRQARLAGMVGNWHR